MSARAWSPGVDEGVLYRDPSVAVVIAPGAYFKVGVLVYLALQFWSEWSHSSKPFLTLVAYPLLPSGEVIFNCPIFSDTSE